MQATHDLIISIINRGFSETVMDAAREKGATGGTILHGKGSLNPTVQKFFNITLHEDKEVVLIVVKKESRNDIMNAILNAAGLTKEAQGITFTLPVEDFVVLSKLASQQQATQDNSDKKQPEQKAEQPNQQEKQENQKPDDDTPKAETPQQQTETKE